MVLAKFYHPIKEVELTFDGVNVEVIEISSTNIITKDANIV